MNSVTQGESRRPAIPSALYHELRGYLVLRVRPREDAEDLCHDVLLHVMARLKEGTAISNLRSYVFTAARHALWKRTRAAGNMESTNPAVLDARAFDAAESERGARVTSAVDDIYRKEIAGWLPDYVASLPDIYRRVLEGNVLEGLKVRDIAAQEHVATGTVKARLHRARRMVRTSLEACCRLFFDGLGRPYDYTPLSCGCSSC